MTKTGKELTPAQRERAVTAAIATDISESRTGVWTGSFVNLVREKYPDLDLVEIRIFGRVCLARGIDPLIGDLIPIVFGKGKPRGGKGGRTLVLIETIDSMRKRAYASGMVKATKGPEWCGPDGVWHEVWLDEESLPVAARFGVHRRDQEEMTWHVRLMKEVRKVGEGDQFWREGGESGQPVNMLGIAAERHAWRKGTPNLFAGMYAPEDSMGAFRGTVGTEMLPEALDVELLGPVVADEDGVIEDGAAPQPNSGDEETPAPTDIPAESTPEPAPESESASQKWVADHPATTLPATAAIIGTLEVALKTRGLTHEQIGAVTGATDNDGVADWVRNQMGDAGTLNEAIADLCNMAASADSE